MKKYSTVSDTSETTSNDDTTSRQRDGGGDSASVASHHRRFKGHKRISSELSEPLTITSNASIVDESISVSTNASSDPYFVFRNDLQNKLDLVDECLTDYLRVVNETVRICSILYQKKGETVVVCCSFVRSFVVRFDFV